MKTFEIHIKNMVCERCIIFVQQVLQQLNAPPSTVELGHVIFSCPCQSLLPILEKKLNEAGLYIVRDRSEATVEELKIQIVKYLDQVEAGNNSGKLSTFLADRLARNYYSLTKLFSKNENKTIESFAIGNKIERVKRLLREGELTLSQISCQLGYSNVQHLSNQFRKVTGISVSEFRMTEKKTKYPMITKMDRPAADKSGFHIAA